MLAQTLRAALLCTTVCSLADCVYCGSVDLYSSGRAVMLVYTCGVQIYASQWCAHLVGTGLVVNGAVGLVGLWASECLLRPVLTGPNTM
jgi:hypothetical protein